MECLFDWCSFTYREDDKPDKVIRKFFNYDFEWQILPGLYGYKKQKYCNEIRVLYDGSEGMGTHVQISSKGLRYLEATEGFDIKRFLTSIYTDKCKFTRVDLAIDCYDNELDLDVIGRKIKSREVVSRWKNSSIVESIKLSDTAKIGHTINFGHRESEIFMRIYDKKLESGSDLPYWVRLELEFKEERANNLVDIFLNEHKELSIYMHEILNNYIRFVDDNGTVNRSRWPVSEWWSKFLLTTRSIKLTSGSLESELDKKIGWLERSVSPTLAMLVQIADGDMTFLYRLVQANKHRLKKKHIALIQQYRVNEKIEEEEKKRVLQYQLYTVLKKIDLINFFKTDSTPVYTDYTMERLENKAIQQKYKEAFVG